MDRVTVSAQMLRMRHPRVSQPLAHARTLLVLPSKSIFWWNTVGHANGHTVRDHCHTSIHPPNETSSKGTAVRKITVYGPRPWLRNLLRYAR